MDLNVSKELNQIVGFVIDLWNKELYTDYILYIDTHDMVNMPAGVIYGTDFILNSESSVKHPIPSLYTISEDIKDATDSYVAKVALFNKEEFYYYKVYSQNNEVIISLGVSSMIFGKSNVHITDIRRIEEQKWELISKSYSRGKKYNGNIGDIHECLMQIVDEEKHLGSPYERMKRNYLNAYNSSMNQDLKVTILENGEIRVNNWFGI